MPKTKIGLMLRYRVDMESFEEYMCSVALDKRGSVIGWFYNINKGLTLVTTLQAAVYRE